MVFADMILTSHAVFTGLEEKPRAGAIAVKGNKILAVGSLLEVNAFVGPSTKKMEFEDELIIPGLHDAHIHLMLGSLFTNGSVDLSSAKSASEAVSLVKAFCQQVQEGWVIGYGWDHTSWESQEFPHRYLIDQQINDRPVLLFHAEGHYTWVNSRAIELAGITKETESPPAGRIQKDGDGEPTGILIETASSLVTNIGLKMSKEKQEALLDQFLHLAAKNGITSVNDLYASSFEPVQNMDLFKEYDDHDKLTVRIHLYPPLNDNIKKYKELRDQYQSEKLRVVGLKQFIDGVVTGHTAVMLDPYKDKPDILGDPVFTEETIKNWVVDADKEGFQIRFHTIGDGAVRMGLDVFEEAQKVNGKRDSRHALEHIEVIDPGDIPRFGQLGVIPSVQPSHIALMPKESHTTRVKEERFPYLYPSRSLLDSNSNLAFGTDFPISPLNPLKEIFYAVTRKDFTGKEVWNEQEKVTVSDAIKAYTKNSAYGVFRENEIGTLEKGKLADIVVLDKNLFDIDLEGIKDVNVRLTIVDGNIIYSSEKVEI